MIESKNTKEIPAIISSLVDTLSLTQTLTEELEKALTPVILAPTPVSTPTVQTPVAGSLPCTQMGNFLTEQTAKVVRVNLFLQDLIQRIQV